MEVATSLVDFIAGSEVVREKIDNLIDSNEEIFFMDLELLSGLNEGLASSIQKNFAQHHRDIRDVFRAHTLAAHGRELDISFFNPILRLKMRDLRSAVLGDLVSFAGSSTRTSQVRPELESGSFICKDCKSHIHGIKQEFIYKEPIFCPNHLCTNRTRYDLDMPGCEFANWQRVHVQENTSEIPRGSLPRSMDVIIRDGLVEKIKPGSHLVFTGYCVALPHGNSIASSRRAVTNDGVADEKPRRHQSELSYTTVFVCIHFTEDTSQYSRSNLTMGMSTVPFTTPLSSKFTVEQLSTIQRMQQTPNLYETLASSLFPTIYGHSCIKAAILLMLVGGITKQKDIRLRGDINILLVGDPGTAKSQFLKQTASAFPCSVYTSGKSSTAAGLTAAVVKDTETGEFTIEAGALMLSDGGVCCIDEFDKMSYKDQVSIHEAMEQQTITIAKAGINATLNSRASILAAANPVRGRYDQSKTLRQNVNLSAPIMSRFDLYFLLLDEVDRENDRKISLKILDNHLKYNSGYRKMYEGGDMKENEERIGKDPLFVPGFTVEEVILYVNYVKDQVPELSSEAKEMLASKYTELRQDSLRNTTNYKMTARHLESLIRLSEALAKIHNDPVVGVSYVLEAYRLVRSSIVEVSSEDIILSCKENSSSYVIKNKEYLKVTNGLIYLLKSETMGREELCMKYLEMIEESLESEAMLESEKEKCLRVIEFLIENEGILFEVDGILHIHPNYDN